MPAILQQLPDAEAQQALSEGVQNTIICAEGRFAAALRCLQGDLACKQWFTNLMNYIIGYLKLSAKHLTGSLQAEDYGIVLQVVVLNRDVAK